MMPSALRLLCIGLLSIGISSGMPLTAADAVSRRDAARLQAKLDRMLKNGRGARPSRMRTAVSEIEVNSYLTYELIDVLPAGVSEPSVAMVGGGRLTGRAVVDLAAVAEKRRSGGMLDPFNYLTGRLPVNASGILRTNNGMGAFELESVTVSGVPVPAWMLQEVVSYYARSSGAPEGVSLDQPFILPAGIREIEVGRGEAIVVQ